MPRLARAFAVAGEVAGSHPGSHRCPSLESLREPGRSVPGCPAGSVVAADSDAPTRRGWPTGLPGRRPMSIPRQGTVPLLTAPPGRAPVSPMDLVARSEARLGRAVDELEAIRSEVPVLVPRGPTSAGVRSGPHAPDRRPGGDGPGRVPVHGPQPDPRGSARVPEDRRLRSNSVADVDGFIARLPSQGIGA
jgi:hypothetical protein